MKKILLILLSFAMVLSTSAISFGYEANVAQPQTSVNLSGFSYEIHGKDIDSTDDYNMNLVYQQLNDKEIKVIIPEIEGVTDESDTVILTESADGLYSCIESDGTNINLEMLDSGNVIFDIIKDNRVYAFGEGRRTAITQYIQSIQEEKDNPTISPRYAGGVVKTKSNSKVYTKMVWNPARDNRLAIRVNTQGSQLGTTVQIITVKGKVPSGYIVKSMNPTGANKNGELLNYIISNAIKYVSLPPMPIAPVASCSGRTFSWSVNSINIGWNNLNDTSDSGNKDNPGKGMMFYLYLDNNTSTNPAPTGTISIRYRVTATGSFDATLSY